MGINKLQKDNGTIINFTMKWFFTENSINEYTSYNDSSVNKAEVRFNYINNCKYFGLEAMSMDEMEYYLKTYWNVRIYPELKGYYFKDIVVS